MIKFKSKGDFSNLENYLKKSKRKSRIGEQATQIAEICLDELKAATPVDSGLTAESWDYEININGRTTSIIFYNHNMHEGLNVALLLEYGHGTSSGTWVEGKEYIDPVIQKNYLNVVNDKWKEMVKL